MLNSSRRPIIAGAAALILAAILLLVYLSHYRNSVKSSNSTQSVLVAQAFIPKGTSSLEVAQKGTWELTPVAKDDVKPGAVTDAALLQSQVALADIFPGQQVTTTDFGVTPTSATLSASPDLLGSGKTAGIWRAVVISVDPVHGISPQAQTGDRVDVYLQNGGTMSLLMQNVLILAAPNQSATNTTSAVSPNYTMRVPTSMVPRFTFANDNTKIWFALRPQKGSKPTPRANITSSNLIPG